MIEDAGCAGILSGGGGPVVQPLRQGTGIVEARDGALIYYELTGAGPPVLFVHGWMMSGRFWKRQVEGLSGAFTVVTMDLRAHGNSSKVLHGHTIPQYARDVRAVVEALRLEDVALVGWSLAGPVALEYWSQFGTDRLRALALVDMTPFPFSPAEWNAHRLRGYGYDQMNASLAALLGDREAFGRRFVDSMFRSGTAPAEDMRWMLAETMKIPAVAAAAIYSDFVMRDHTSVLGTITVPTVVFAGDSTIFERGVEQGRCVAGLIPGATFVASDGHVPFYEDAERFNAELAKTFSGGLAPVAARRDRPARGA